MSKIVDYTILYQLYASDLKDDVKTYIKAGRQPFGNMHHSGDHAYQAMVKYEPSQEETVARARTVSDVFLPSETQMRFCQSNGSDGISMPPVYTCRNCGKQWRWGQPTPVCTTLPSTDKNEQL